MQRTILVVVDPRVTDAQPVLERVAWLAARAGARLELFAADYDSDLDSGHAAWRTEPNAKERLLVTHRQRLEELARPLRARGADRADDGGEQACFHFGRTSTAASARRVTTNSD
jgi:hypothetical protein